MLVQLVRTILIIIVVYYLAKWLMRIVLPFLARYFVRKTVEQQQKQSGDFSQSTNKKTEKKNFTDDLGEYVDYEEVEDNKK